MFSENKKARRREQILCDCLSLFAKQGLENTSISDLAQYCNTYKAALYNYFKDKDDIVLETAKLYMTRLWSTLEKQPLQELPLQDAMKIAFAVLVEEKQNLRFVYQVVSSPKYGDRSRQELSSVYTTYLNLSEEMAQRYNISHEEFRPYFLMFVATIHDYCLWENMDLVTERLNYIYKKMDELQHHS